MANGARIACCALALVATACTSPSAPPAPSPTASTTPLATPTQSAAAGFALVGHEPLLARGMNAGLALHGRYAYVGSRTDGSHADAGVIIVDVADPARPRVAGQIGRPHQANRGESSRELRVWPQAGLLIVLNIPCEPGLHACAAPSPAATVRLYDIAGARAGAPVLVATHRPSATPHEMFLWTDPARPGRALLYLSTSEPGARATSLMVADVSQARAGVVREILAWTGGAERSGFAGAGMHSVSVSRDGTRAYLAYLRAGVAVLDTTGLASGRDTPRVRLLGEPVAWEGAGAHSAVPVPGRPLLVATEEVYGGAASCPWGWLRVVDLADERRPRITGEHRLRENTQAFCPTAPRGAYSYATHNPTPATGDVVLVSWHAGGLRAISIADPARPAEIAAYVPTPLPRVATEDPALTTGAVRVAMWSSPIVRDGLVYVVDIRNGLFILRLPAVAGVGWADGASTVAR